MSTDWRFRIAAALLATAFVVDAATPGQEAYQSGYRAYMAGNWEEAAERMRRALQEDPHEGLQRFKDRGLNKVDYFPHLYLGLALQALGRDTEALQALRESSRQAVVPASDYAVLLSKHVRELEARLARPPQPTATEAPVVLPTSAEAHAAGGLAATPVPGELERPLPIVVSTPAPSPRAGKPFPVSSPVVSPASQSSIDANSASPDSTQALKDGIRDFFAGSYERAEARLRPHASLPPARLFLAYAMAARFLVSGRRDSLLAAEARDHFARAVREGARLPADDVISPAVRRLLSLPAP